MQMEVVIHIFSVGEKVWFVKEVKLQIFPIQVWMSLWTPKFGMERVVSKCLVDDNIHVVSGIEVFPIEEWPNLVHPQLVTLDGFEKNKISGRFIEPMYAKYARLLTP